MTDSLSSFVVNDNCIMSMNVGQQITDIVGSDSGAWALATSFVPLLNSSVDGCFLQAMITSCSRLHIPLQEQQLTQAASNSVEKCLAISKYAFFLFEMLHTFNMMTQKVYALITTGSRGGACR